MLRRYMVGDAGVANPFLPVVDYVTNRTPATLKASGTWDPGSCASNSAISTTLAVSCLLTGDVAIASHSALGNQPDVLISAIASNDTATVVLKNNSGAALDLPSGTLHVIAFRP
jgi:hypothetical protein